MVTLQNTTSGREATSEGFHRDDAIKPDLDEALTQSLTRLGIVQQSLKPLGLESRSSRGVASWGGRHGESKTTLHQARRYASMACGLPVVRVRFSLLMECWFLLGRRPTVPDKSRLCLGCLVGAQGSANPLSYVVFLRIFMASMSRSQEHR
jgi:hypothetical protein